VKDPELRRVAYQKVLEELISAASKEKLPPAPSKTPSDSKKSPKKPKKRSGPTGRVQDLTEEGFFKKPKTIAQVKAELENRGYHIPLTSLSGPLQKLVQKRILRRNKVKASGKKQTYAYSNW
jgi:hypothetical protein